MRLLPPRRSRTVRSPGSGGGSADPTDPVQTLGGYAANDSEAAASAIHPDGPDDSVTERGLGLVEETTVEAIAVESITSEEAIGGVTLAATFLGEEQSIEGQFVVRHTKGSGCSTSTSNPTEHPSLEARDAVANGAAERGSSRGRQVRGGAIPGMADTAVWFDLDGTLCQFERGFDALVRDALVAAGARNPPEGAHDVFAERIFSALEDCEAEPYELAFEAVVAELGAEVDPNEAATAYREIEVESTELVEGAHATIDRAAERATAVGVLTNGEGELQRAKLAAHDLDDRFDAVVISNEVGVRKPDPEIFAVAAERVDADEYVFVADEYETDVAPAERAGWTAIHVRNDEGPAASVNRLASLETLLL